MQNFFKELCKDMKEVSERVNRVKQGDIESLPDKKGVIYNIQESKRNG